MPLLATASQQSTDMTGILILLLPLLLIGFMFWSQRRRAKQMERVQAALEPGAEVSTTSGLRGTLVALDAEVAVIEAAPGVQLRFDRRAVVPVTTAATTPAPNRDEGEAGQGQGD